MYKFKNENFLDRGTNNHVSYMNFLPSTLTTGPS